MANKRDVDLVNIGVSQNAYRELLYFCMQYDEKKTMLKIFSFISSISYSAGEQARSAYGSFDRTANLALVRMKLERDVKLIEDVARSTDEGLAEFLISNICYEIPYEHLDIPCGRRQFYSKRKLFFAKLYQKKIIEEDY